MDSGMEVNEPETSAGAQIPHTVMRVAISLYSPSAHTVNPISKRSSRASRPTAKVQTRAVLHVGKGAFI